MNSNTAACAWSCEPNRCSCTRVILQHAEKAFDDRVVITIAFATQPAHQPMLSQKAPVGEELAQSFMPLQFILELAAMFFVLGAASWLFARVSWRIDLTEIP